MAEPIDSPIERWELLFRGRPLSRRWHSRQEWAQIADAIRTADARRAGAVRGDAAWCQAAADTYTQLHEAGAYAEPAQTAGWPADEHLVRAFLDAPPVPAGVHATMLDAYGWDHAFASAHRTHPTNLTVLVAAMQELGLVGVPGQRVSVLRAVVDGSTHDDLVQVVLWHGDRPPRVSNPVPAAELAPPATSPAERVVAALHNIAAVAADLAGTDHPPPAPGRHRIATEPLPDDVDGHPIGTRAHPFRLITGGADTATPPPATPPVPVPARHRHT